MTPLAERLLRGALRGARRGERVVELLKSVLEAQGLEPEATEGARVVTPSALRMRRRRLRAPDVSPALRDAVLARDGRVCALCGRPIVGEVPHIDHRVSIASGGLTTLDNLQVAHRFCNQSKGAS